MARREFRPTTETSVINLATGKTQSFDSRDLLGQRLRYYRKKAKASQPALAKKLNVTKNSISNWEAGRSRPDTDNIVGFCKAVDITPSQLFGFSGDPTK